MIGYLGFDMAIGPGGVLGPPIPTHAVLERGVSPALRGDIGVRLSSTAALDLDYGTLKALGDKGDTNAKQLVTELDALSPLAPATYPCNLLGVRNPGGPLVVVRASGTPLGAEAGFDRVTLYRGQLLTSIRAIKRAQGNPAAAVTGFPTRGPEAEAYLREQLKANEAALAGVDGGLEKHSALLTRAKTFLAGVEG